MNLEARGVAVRQVRARVSPFIVGSTHTGSLSILLNRPYADVSQVGEEERPIRRHRQRGGTVEPGVFGVTSFRLITVAVGVVLQGRGRSATRGSGLFLLSEDHRLPWIATPKVLSTHSFISSRLL